MVGLLVETDDFAYAAWALSSGAADPLTQALFRLQATLDGCAGMAGSDPAGRSWAAGYDPLAAEALTGLHSLVNGCYRLSAMSAQTCRNYAAAERASTTDRWARASVETDVAQLPARLPSAADMAATVGRGLTELFDRPLVAAAVTPVRTLAPEMSTVNGITRVEMAGERAVAAEANRAPQFGKIDLRAEEAAGGHTIANHVG